MHPFRSVAAFVTLPPFVLRATWKPAPLRLGEFVTEAARRSPARLKADVDIAAAQPVAFKGPNCALDDRIRFRRAETALEVR